MAFVRPILRSALDRTADPIEALERTNHILVDERRTGLFVTVLAGVLDLDSGHFGFANAGHEMPLLAPPGGVEPRWVPGGGPLVGVFGRLDLSPLSVDIRPGDRLVLYTDGITDARAPDGTRFGDERLQRAIRDSCNGSALETCTTVIREVREFVGGAEAADDLALLVLRRLPQPSR
jgi:sigma-B regulation protein RsbU (phosphoserine phosphatase)